MLVSSMKVFQVYLFTSYHSLNHMKYTTLKDLDETTHDAHFYSEIKLCETLGGDVNSMLLWLPVNLNKIVCGSHKMFNLIQTPISV